MKYLRARNSIFARRALAAIFGAPTKTGILMIVLLLTSLGWFTDTIFEIIKLFFWDFLLIIPFPALLAIMYLHSKKYISDVIPKKLDSNKASFKVLIVTLSVIKGKKAVLDESGNTREDFLPLDGEALEALRKPDANLGNWETLIRAVQPHMRTLDKLILISSRGKESSHNQVACAKEILEQRYSSLKGKIYTLSSISTLGDNIKNEGADFNSIEECSDVIEKVYKYCVESQHYTDTDILIDATGGTKITTIASAICSLANGRCLQYVPNGKYDKEELMTIDHYGGD